MIAVAQRNADDYGLHDRVEYVQGNGAELPFEDSSFDGVFTAGSLHEWTAPGQTFLEIWRVLKVGGRFPGPGLSTGHVGGVQVVSLDSRQAEGNAVRSCHFNQRRLRAQ